MKDRKLVRGKPIYLYRNSQYLEMPDKCVIKRVVYDESSNRSFVYCKKSSKVLEVLCTIIIVSCVVLNLGWLHGLSYRVHYNSLAVYYNGELFVNVLNDGSNMSDLHVSILSGEETVYDDVIKPGEYLVSVPVSTPSKSYTLVLEYRTMLGITPKSVTITPLIRGLSDE